MNTDKKNQHYIPKFYLRNFSFQGNNNQIGIFNLKSSFYFQRSKLKTQGSKNFFYGYDGSIEDWLSDIEGHLATLIREIKENELTPTMHSEKHIELLAFVGLTYLRNPVFIENIKSTRDQLKASMFRLDPEANIDNFFPEISHDQAIDQALSSIKDTIENLSDLGYKLLINKTSTPFITSDFPIVKYNQFLEQRKWEHGKTGLGLMGLQIIVPITPKLTVFFYDKEIYKLGFKKKTIMEVHTEKDVDQLNLLQVLNCFETVFFNESISEHYISRLLKKSIGFNRPNELHSREGFIAKKDESVSDIKKENLIIVSSSDSEIKLELSGLKQLSSAKNLKLDDRVAQMRKHPAKIRRESDCR